MVGVVVGEAIAVLVYAVVVDLFGGRVDQPVGVIAVWAAELEGVLAVQISVIVGEAITVLVYAVVVDLVDQWVDACIAIVTVVGVLYVAFGGCALGDNGGGISEGVAVQVLGPVPGAGR